MRRILTMVAIVLAVSGSAAAIWACSYGSPTIEQALASDPAARAKAIAELREQGAAGLEEVIALRDLRREQLAAAAAPEQAASLQEQIKQLDSLIDEVGGARYCSVSKLYWHTDFAKAQAEAARQNKPILSLRMLGKLNEEFSCANSRFFRTTLYANDEIAATLRNRFVLHWESVRPVPRVTIDFGDGRKLERTLTGNSIHYVVDKSGTPLDGLPGLHGPAAFKTWLTRAEDLATEYAATAADERERYLQAYHQERHAAVSVAFAADLARLSPRPQSAADDAQRAPSPPTAAAATQIAAPKRRAEMPIIRQVADRRPLPESMDGLDDATWQQIAALHAEDAQLDKSSIAVIRTETEAGRAGRLSFSKAVVEDPLVKLVRNLQSSIALDTVRNEYVLHRQMHEWFANNKVGHDLPRLNERVYAQLFLTPSSDPWLGLMTPDTYTALQNNGIATTVVVP